MSWMQCDDMKVCVVSWKLLGVSWVFCVLPWQLWATVEIGWNVLSFCIAVTAVSHRSIDDFASNALYCIAMVKFVMIDVATLLCCIGQACRSQVVLLRQLIKVRATIMTCLLYIDFENRAIALTNVSLLHGYWDLSSCWFYYNLRRQNPPYQSYILNSGVAKGKG